MEAPCAPELWSKEEMLVRRKASGRLTLAGGGGDSLLHGRDPTLGWVAHLNSADLVPEGRLWRAGGHVTSTPTQGPAGWSTGASRAHPWQEDALGSVRPSQWAKVGSRAGGRPSRPGRKQLAMSKMMFSRDQTSDFWLKEKLRALGAIQTSGRGLLAGARRTMHESCAPPGSKQLENGPLVTLLGEGDMLSEAPVSKILAREAGAHQAGCVRALSPWWLRQEHLDRGVSRKAETCVLVQHLASTCQDLEAKLSVPCSSSST